MERNAMRFNAPTTVVFVIALVLAALALLSLVLFIPVVSPNRFWFMTAAWAVLTFGNILKGV
jgi:uncharacterized membrane protein YqjE